MMTGREVGKKKPQQSQHQKITLVQQQSKPLLLKSLKKEKSELPTKPTTEAFTSLARPTTSSRNKLSGRPTTPLALSKRPVLVPVIKQPVPLRPFTSKASARTSTAVVQDKRNNKTIRPKSVNKKFEPILLQVKFNATKSAVARQKRELNMVDMLDACKTYDDAPIWLTFRLWQYGDNLKQLNRLMKLELTESCGNEVADMKHLFVYHGMSSCLDCFMIDEDTNMRTVGFIIDDDVLIGFNTVLPYMTQYFPDFLERFYGTSPEENATIRQWVNYCVRNVRGRRISEFMWQEMEDHVGKKGFFGSTYKTMADTLLYISLYPYVKRWLPGDFERRYNLSRWFRLMQAEDKLRGANELFKISRTSELHPKYPFYGMLPDPIDKDIF